MRPEDLLPDEQDRIERDGISIRKGTVGAFLASARVWLDPLTTDAERQRAADSIETLRPALEALGLFDILEVRDDALRSSMHASATGDGTTPPAAGPRRDDS